ncbi:Transcriptional regulator, Crp/Fnr family [Candidatus Sulfopaludibacter sp. SbA3]|nr:Transcriptional regulator, Crp/Fnr family [Candidatus Sulfopaludibacter sp. SbA3]
MNRSFRGQLNHEDPLNFLPRKPVQEFPKGSVVYDKQANGHLYVVILGRVIVTSAAEDGGLTVGRIVSAEGLFGESCLVGGRNSESAVALDSASVMAWTRAEIEQHIEREPRLGIALSQYLVRQCIELQDRIESMAVHKTPERVMLALVQLAEALGSPMADGSTRVASLTHQTIAQYVGTSREIVTFQMNRLRRLGMLRYTRKFIDIYARAIRETLRNEGVSVPEGVLTVQQSAV